MPAAILSYAVDWFNYHAQQRVQAFYLFLVVQSAVIVALATLYKDVSHITAAYISLVGVVLAVPFWLLEIRNTELVNNGRHTLDRIERCLSDDHAFPWNLPRQRDVLRADFNSATHISGLVSTDYPVKGEFPLNAIDVRGSLRPYRWLARHSVIFRGFILFTVVVEAGVCLRLLFLHTSWSWVQLPAVAVLGLIVLAWFASWVFRPVQDDRGTELQKRVAAVVREARKQKVDSATLLALVEEKSAQR